MNRSSVREVLDCASALALFRTVETFGRPNKAAQQRRGPKRRHPHGGLLKLDGFMKRVFAIGLLLLLTLPLAAAERGSGRGWGNRGDGFETLFNGTNLLGWKGDTTLWSVQKSNIVGR